jgi:hypothetical protein
VKSIRETRSFTWQVGYAVFTVSESQVPRLRNYIATQQARHARMTFQEEFVALLRANRIEFDERYLWR